MPDVVVVGGIVECSHAALGGKGPVTTGSSKLTVGGMQVLVSGQEAGIPFSAPPCTQTIPGPSPAPCLMTKAATTGVSTKLTIGGSGVILANAQGLTDNSNLPTSTWSVNSAGQSKLTVSA